jgi:hypothetical protein
MASDWRVPGTSPVGQVSYPGASDGGAEPWFAEAVSTVGLDLKKADETLKAFTKEVAAMKMAEFAKESGVASPDAMDKLVASMGYDKFLEASTKTLVSQWEKIKS